MSGAGQLPVVLVIAEFDELRSEEGFPEVFREYAAGRWDLRLMSVMDATMKTLPAGVAASILSIWLFKALHRDLLLKLLAETGRPVVVNLTDDRPNVIAWLDARPGVTRVKKPASLHWVAEILEAVVAGRTPPAGTGESEPGGDAP